MFWDGLGAGSGSVTQSSNRCGGRRVLQLRLGVGTGVLEVMTCACSLCYVTLDFDFKRAYFTLDFKYFHDVALAFGWQTKKRPFSYIKTSASIFNEVNNENIFGVCRSWPEINQNNGKLRNERARAEQRTFTIDGTSSAPTQRTYRTSLG